MLGDHRIIALFFIAEDMLIDPLLGKYLPMVQRKDDAAIKVYERWKALNAG